MLKPGREFVELGRNQLDGRTYASYAVADDAIFIRTENRLFRIQE